MVRMGQDPNLIEFISHRFHQLDEDGGGTLSILEITGKAFIAFHCSEAAKLTSFLASTQVVNTTM